MSSNVQRLVAMMEGRSNKNNNNTNTQQTTSRRVDSASYSRKSTTSAATTTTESDLVLPANVSVQEDSTKGIRKSVLESIDDKVRTKRSNGVINNLSTIVGSEKADDLSYKSVPDKLSINKLKDSDHGPESTSNDERATTEIPGRASSSHGGDNSDVSSNHLSFNINQKRRNDENSLSKPTTSLHDAFSEQTETTSTVLSKTNFTTKSTSISDTSPDPNTNEMSPTLKAKNSKAKKSLSRSNKRAANTNNETENNDSLATPDKKTTRQRVSRIPVSLKKTSLKSSNLSDTIQTRRQNPSRKASLKPDFRFVPRDPQSAPLTRVKRVGSERNIITSPDTKGKRRKTIDVSAANTGGLTLGTILQTWTQITAIHKELQKTTPLVAQQQLATPTKGSTVTDRHMQAATPKSSGVLQSKSPNTRLRARQSQDMSGGILAALDFNDEFEFTETKTNIQLNSTTILDKRRKHKRTLEKNILHSLGNIKTSTPTKSARKPWKRKSVTGAAKRSSSSAKKNSKSKDADSNSRGKAFDLFLRDQQDDLKNKNPTSSESEIIKLAENLWKTATLEEKRQYQERALKDIINHSTTYDRSCEDEKVQTGRKIASKTESGNDINGTTSSGQKAPSSSRSKRESKLIKPPGKTTQKEARKQMSRTKPNTKSLPVETLAEKKSVIRPKAPPTQDEKGFFAKPPGRNPIGYAWDKIAGVWISSPIEIKPYNATNIEIEKLSEEESRLEPTIQGVVDIVTDCPEDQISFNLPPVPDEPKESETENNQPNSDNKFVSTLLSQREDDKVVKIPVEITAAQRSFGDNTQGSHSSLTSSLHTSCPVERNDHQFVDCKSISNQKIDQSPAARETGPANTTVSTGNAILTPCQRRDVNHCSQSDDGKASNVEKQVFSYSPSFSACGFCHSCRMESNCGSCLNCVSIYEFDNYVNLNRLHEDKFYATLRPICVLRICREPIQRQSYESKIPSRWSPCAAFMDRITQDNGNPTALNESRDPKNEVDQDQNYSIRFAEIKNKFEDKVNSCIPSKTKAETEVDQDRDSSFTEIKSTFQENIAAEISCIPAKNCNVVSSKSLLVRKSMSSRKLDSEAIRLFFT